MNVLRPQASPGNMRAEEGSRDRVLNLKFPKLSTLLKLTGLAAVPGTELPRSHRRELKLP